MKFCMECGTPAEDSQRYCRICGHKFPEMEQTPEEPGEEAGEKTEIVLEQEDQEGEEWTERVPDSPEMDSKSTAAVNPGAFGASEPDEGATVYVAQEEPEDSQRSQTSRTEFVPADSGENGEASPTAERKPLPVVKIGIAAAVLVLCAGAAGWALLHSEKDSKEVLIAGQTYVISQTDALVVEDPDEQDWNSIASLTQLTSLTVHGDGKNTAVTAEDLQQLSALPKLTDLELEGVQLESIENLELLEHLEVLAIRNAGLDSEQCMELPALQHLTALDLEGNAIQDLTFLSNFTALTRLNLADNKITDYTPLSACTDLDSLSVDLCQAGVIGRLDSLKELSVAGEPVEDLPAFLEEQKNTAELYDSIMEWFDQDDFETIEVALDEYVSADGIIYANGWLMDFGSDWEEIRSAIPEDTMVVVSDDTGVYYGQMSQDQRSGQGTQYLPASKSWYRGSWSNNLPNGSGSYYKPVGDGRTLEFVGTYVNGYEDGSMNMVLHDGSNIQSVAYTSQQGTRTTLQQISDTQYAFAYLDGVYWCDVQPGGHGVAVDGIAYQQEQPVAETLPDTETPAAEPSSNSSSSESVGGSASSKPSGDSSSSAAPAQQSAPAQTQTPAAPAPTAPAAEPEPEPTAPAIPDIAGQEELQDMMQDAEAYAQQLLEELE